MELRTPTTLVKCAFSDLGRQVAYTSVSVNTLRYIQPRIHTPSMLDYTPRIDCTWYLGEGTSFPPAPHASDLVYHKQMKRPWFNKAETPRCEYKLHAQLRKKAEKRNLSQLLISSWWDHWGSQPTPIVVHGLVYYRVGYEQRHATTELAAAVERYADVETEREHRGPSNILARNCSLDRSMPTCFVAIRLGQASMSAKESLWF